MNIIFTLRNGRDFAQLFQRNKNHLYISCLEDEKRQIEYGILLSVAMN